MPIEPDWLRTGGAFDGPLARGALGPSATQRLPGAGERVGPFRIEHELSRGGMAVVYLATRADGEFQQRVALKWMRAGRDRDTAELLFRRERDVLASLEHPGIARLVDGGCTAGGELWFAMELVQGEPIDGWHETRRSVVADRVRSLLELCRALEFAHARLLIHRDIKPANVLVDEAGRVRLLDFGIARFADQDDADASRAMTPGYASPEQLAGDEVTIASDVYQTGLLLARLLGVLRPGHAGVHVTHARAAQDPARSAAEVEPSAVRHLPRDLAAIVLRATALSPAQRYPSIPALSDDLQRWLERRPVRARGSGAIYRITCRVRRHPLASIGLVAAVAALLLLGADVLRQRDAARAEAERAVQEASRARTALDFLTEMLQWASPTRHGGEPVSVDAALQRGVQQLAEVPADQPRARAELLSLLGNVHVLREELDRARPLLEEAYGLLAAIPDASPALRARIAVDLALCTSTSDPTTSLRLYREAIDALAGDASQAGLRIAARRLHASAVYRAGDIGTAAQLMNEALADAERMLPEESVEISQIRNNVAGYLGDLGRSQEALALRRINYAATMAQRGPRHPATSMAASTLARSLLALGELDEAETLIRTDGATRSALWGDSHAQYGVHLQNLARLQRRRGELDAARDSITRAIALSRTGGAAGAFPLASQLTDLGEIERDAGRLEAAEAALREALSPELQRTASVKDFGGRRLLLVSVLRLRGARDEAQAELARLDEEMSPLPPDHPRRGLAALERAELATEHDARLRAARAAEVVLSSAPTGSDAYRALVRVRALLGDPADAP